VSALGGGRHTRHFHMLKPKRRGISLKSITRQVMEAPGSRHTTPANSISPVELLITSLPSSTLRGNPDSPSALPQWESTSYHPLLVIHITILPIYFLPIKTRTRQVPRTPRVISCLRPPPQPFIRLWPHIPLCRQPNSTFRLQQN
jgi:hypothetical protein